MPTPGVCALLAFELAATMSRWLWLALHPAQWYGGAKYRRTHGLKSYSPTVAAAIRDRKAQR